MEGVQSNPSVSGPSAAPKDLEAPDQQACGETRVLKQACFKIGTHIHQAIHVLVSSLVHSLQPCSPRHVRLLTLF